MNEREALISHASDLKEKSANESVVVCTSFLSVSELSDIIKLERVNSEFVDTFYYGGYNDAERKTAIFVPKFYCVTDETLESFLSENGNPLALLKITKDKFASVSHRDYLGALIGLGIKRETVGDILTNENGCYIFCLKSMSSFISENLKKAGRAQLKISVCEDFKSEQLPENKTQIVFTTVASPRLDCIVASAFKLSRNNAASMILQGLVFVNSQQALKADRVIAEGDTIALRGKGKVVAKEIIGESKKGRIRLYLKKYI